MFQKAVLRLILSIVTDQFKILKSLSFMHKTTPRYVIGFWVHSKLFMQLVSLIYKFKGNIFVFPKFNCRPANSKPLALHYYLTLLNQQMKSFIAKRVISILVNLRYLRFKLLKYKENNKKMCNTFDHNFKNIPLYIMSNVSLEMYYFVLYDGALTLKMSKMALNAFCDKTLQIMWHRQL